MTNRSSTHHYLTRPRSNRAAARKVWDMANAGGKEPTNLNLHNGTWKVFFTDGSTMEISHTAEFTRKQMSRYQAAQAQLQAAVELEKRENQFRLSDHVVWPELPERRVK